MPVGPPTGLRVMPRFAAVAAIASRVLSGHASDHGLCAVCGQAWPGELVVLAGQNLSAL